MRVTVRIWGRVGGCGVLCAGVVVSAAATAYAVGIEPGEAGGEKTQRPTLERAATLRMKGAYQEAMAVYAKLFMAEPTEVAAACGAAACLLQTGRYQTALESLESVAERGAKSPRWHRTVAEALTAMGRYGEAIGHLERALSLDVGDHASRYLLGRLYERVGDRERAIATYKRFDALLAAPPPAGAAGLTAFGAGLLRYSAMVRHPKLVERTQMVLQDFFQRAYGRIDRGYWPARVASGDLLRSKSRHEEAAKDYLAALDINGNLSVAHLGLGWIAQSMWDFDEVEHRLSLARRSNPRSAEAYRLEAALRLTERRYAAATEAAEGALAINANDVAALGYAAAAAYGLNRPEAVAAFRDRAIGITSRPARFHRILGDTLSGLRQYAASERAYRSAIEADPTDPNPRTELGMMYMQWGLEDKAHEVLTAAWDLDSFDGRTLNTLTLLESIESFSRYDSAHFVIKYDASADAVLAPYMADYLETIHDELCEDYGWSPREKTIIEVFPSHRAFGVRITGKPWIHTVGACTGRVIAMESPRNDARLQGRYHYANVLRHEYTHTVTLGATDNRIPHWMTEGLAVMQEDAPRSFAWSRLLADALRRDALFTLSTINWAFIRPKQPDDRQRAYAQSEWMCEFLVARFGYGVLNRMLAGFRDHRSQAEVLQAVTGLTPERFDAAFAAWARKEAANWGLDLRRPEPLALLRKAVTTAGDDADVWARLARAEWDAGELAKAVVAARRALELDEDHRAALTVLGEALWVVRERAGAEDAEGKRRIDEELVAAMRRLLAIDQGGWIAPKVLASIALESGELETAAGLFRRFKRALPLDPAADRALAGIYLQKGRQDAALPHLLELARSGDEDADIAFTLGSIFDGQRRYGEARYWYGQALYVDAYRADIHAALADVCERLGAAAALRRELSSLCLLQPTVVGWFERAARAFAAADDLAAAREFARRAVELDAETKVRSLLDDGG